MTKFRSRAKILERTVIDGNTMISEHDNALVGGLETQLQKKFKRVMKLERELESSNTKLARTNASLTLLQLQLYKLSHEQAQNLSNFSSRLGDMNEKLGDLVNNEETFVKNSEKLTEITKNVEDIQLLAEKFENFTREINQKAGENDRKIMYDRCVGHKQENLATRSVKFMTTDWIRPFPGYIFTGVSCSSEGRVESKLEEQVILDEFMNDNHVIVGAQVDGSHSAERLFESDVKQDVKHKQYGWVFQFLVVKFLIRFDFFNFPVFFVFFSVFFSFFSFFSCLRL